MKAASMRFQRMLRRFFIGIAVSSAALVHAQGDAKPKDRNPVITAGMMRFEEGNRIGVRDIYLRPAKEQANRNNRFFPTAGELVDGEGAAIYLRMNSEGFSRMQAIRQIGMKDYDEQPLEKLSVPEIQGLMLINRSEMKRFVYRSRAGWNYPLDEQPWMTILLPDVQESRSYARAMMVFSRASILEGDIPQAEEWILCTLGLAKHVSETPFMVTQLVSVADASMALTAIEELMQHPEAGNYYWDLANLPRPFVDYKRTWQFEARMWEKSIPSLSRLDDISSEEAWQDVVEKVFLGIHEWHSDAFPKLDSPEGKKTWKEWVALSRENLHRVAPELAGRMKRMSDAEIGIRYWWLRLKQFENCENAMSLEPHLALPRIDAALREMQIAFEREPLMKSWISSSVYVPTGMSHFVLLDQRIAMLRVIESIRDWSANHDGKLPASLDQLDLPVPLDIVNNRPFEWHLDGDGTQGELSGALIELVGFEPGAERFAGWRYRIMQPDVNETEAAEKKPPERP